MKNIEAKTMWRHFKGKYYLIEEIAQDANTQKFIIVYRALYGDNTVWVRTLNDFLESVDPNRSDNITGQAGRFERVYSID